MVAAERAARLLGERPPIVGARSGAAPDALDVVRLAQWVITGRDPWPPLRAEVGDAVHMVVSRQEGKGRSLLQQAADAAALAARATSSPAPRDPGVRG